jgi:sulfate permease, SulP family
MPWRNRAANLPGDLIAGLTLWAIFAAQGLAYSRLAHATPAAGLATGVAGAFLYAALGSSLRISIGPAGGIAAIVGSVMAAAPHGRLGLWLALLALMVAAVQLLAGLARISFLSRLFPTPVFVGYIAGTGVTILFGQARDLVSHGWLAFAIGAAAGLAVVALRKLAPRVPGPFVVLLAATVVSALAGFGGRGVPVIGSALGQFGRLVLPTEASWADLRALIGPALSLGLISYVDALANGNMLAQPSDPPIRPRREYFALAGVNTASALLGGFTAGCSTSRSLVGIRAGERTRLAPIVAGVLLVLTGLSVVRFLSPLPLTALAGVVFVAAFDLIDVARLREFWRLRRADLVTALVAGAGVVAFGMIKGVLIGVAAALIESLRRAMQPNRMLVSPRAGEHVYEPFTAEAVAAAGELVIYRFGSPLFFGNAEVFLQDMRALVAAAPTSLRTVVVNADALGIPDATARDCLVTAQRELGRKQIRLVFGNVRASLREALTRTGAFTLIDEGEFIADLRRIRGGPLAPIRT